MSQPEDLQSPCSREVDFTTFVLSLSTAALQQLGVETGESGKPPSVDLCLARQTIDVLEMLEKKTRGNLSEAEGKLISAILYDLRLRYVKSARGTGG